MQIIQEWYAAEILCLLAQTPITIVLTWYIYRNRHKYPLRQSSPLLTISCLISFLLINIVVFWARIAIDYTKWNSQEYNCFMNIPTVKYLAQVYLFLCDLPIILYFFKLFRVLTAHYQIFYNRRWLVSFMKSQIKLLIGGFIWCSVFVFADYMNRIGENEEQTSKIIYKFMCIQLNQTSIFFTVRYFLGVFLYYWQYFLSYRVSRRLSFKGQLNTLLVLILINNLVALVHSVQEISYVRELYYYIMGMYLASTLVFWYYFGKTQPLVSPLFTEDSWQDYTFQILMKEEDVRDSFQYFFEKRGKIYLFNAYLTFMYIQFAQDKPEKQMSLIKQLINVNLGGHLQQFDKDAVQTLSKDYNMNVHKKQYNIVIKQLHKKCEQVFKQWSGTKAKYILSKKWQKNKVIVSNTFALNIDII